MAEVRDILVDDSGRMILRGGVVATGDSFTQEVALVLITNKGELRHDPLCGCDLVRRMNAPLNRDVLQREMRIQLERDGKRWEEVKDGITTTING